MLNNFLLENLVQNLGYEPTDDQFKAIESFANFFLSSEHKVFLLNGYAGTGKTTLIKSITKLLTTIEYPYILLAPTGRAAKILANYCNTNAYTIHKYIYRQLSAEDFSFELNYNPLRQAFFFIDESSMLSNEATEYNIFGSGHLLDDLLEFVFMHHKNKIVFIGDTAQLPPIGSNEHPALKPQTFENKGFSTLYVELKEVIRQEKNSCIYKNATALRENIENQKFLLPPFIQNKNEFVFISSSDALEMISSSYDKVGIDETIILSYSNKRALQINKAIRSKIHCYDSELVNGELLMVVKNNYMPLPKDMPFNFIANGEMIYVKKFLRDEDLYGFRFKKVLVELSSNPGYELECYLMEETLYLEQANLSRERQDELYNQISFDYADIKSKKKRISMIRQNPYFNALHVKYAYAITGHKSQGGQWKHVYIDLSFLNYIDVGPEQLKWLYTAITRAKEKVYILDFPQKYADYIKN